MDERTVLVLLGIASVAATFAGFSGVVAVFGRRAHGEWFLEDRFRLTNMLVTSLGAGLYAFIPLIEVDLHPFAVRLLHRIHGVHAPALVAPHQQAPGRALRSGLVHRVSVFRPGRPRSAPERGLDSL